MGWQIIYTCRIFICRRIPSSNATRWPSAPEDNSHVLFNLFRLPAAARVNRHRVVTPPTSKYFVRVDLRSVLDTFQPCSKLIFVEHLFNTPVHIMIYDTPQTYRMCAKRTKKTILSRIQIVLNSFWEKHTHTHTHTHTLRPEQLNIFLNR